MSKTTTRPFLPCGSYDRADTAKLAANRLNEEKPDQTWELAGQFGPDNRYAIQRVH